MRISLGIFAYNSARSIEETLESLFSQDLVKSPPAYLERLELWVVANGCTDDTVGIARRAMERLAPRPADPRLAFGVRELPVAGKSNAWNEFVHGISDPGAEVLFAMDSDISFLSPRALTLLADALRTDPGLVVAVGRPFKHVQFHSRKTLFDRVSIATSTLFRRTQPGAITGQLYGIRGPFVRTCWMPVGLQVEDGFLRAMVVTDQFRKREELSRVRMVEEAGFRFEAYMEIPDIVRHEIRIMEGSIVNSFLYRDLWANSGTRGAGDLIRERNARNPAWPAELVDGAVRRRGSWVVPRPFLTSRLASLRRMGFWKALRYAPIALLRTALDGYVSTQVNRRLRRRSWGAW